MKLGKQPPEETVELMMTPMIDVVFQLLIFFMVVATISDIVGNVNVTLPLADYAQPDVPDDVGRLVINIEPDGRYIVGGSPRTVKELDDLIAVEAKLTQRKDRPGVSERSILMRVDQHAAFRWAQTVMTLCTRKGLYKLSFAGKTEEEEKPAP